MTRTQTERDIPSEKLSTVDRPSSNLDLDTSVFGLVHAPQIPDNNRQTSHSKPLARRNEFGWQLNLQVSSSSLAVNPMNNNNLESSVVFFRYVIFFYK